MTAPAPNASRMNSWSSMGVGGVVPALGQVGRAAVEGDAAADEQQPLGDVLDRAELVRDVEDGDAQLPVQPREQRRERILRVGVDAGGRLVEDQQPRLCGDRLSDEGALLLAAGEGGDRLVGLFGQADAVDRRVDGVAIVGGERPEQVPPGDAARGRRPRGRSRAPRFRAAPAAGGRRPRPRRARRAGSPNSRTVPACGCSRPTISRSSVVLPPPFGPAIATNCPAGI